MTSGLFVKAKPPSRFKSEFWNHYYMIYIKRDNQLDNDGFFMISILSPVAASTISERNFSNLKTNTSGKRNRTSTKLNNSYQIAGSYYRNKRQKLK